MTELPLLLGGGLVAALVSGVSGFGFAVVASALWSHAIEPQRVTALVLVLQLALNLAYLPFLWREISLTRLLPFALGALVGVPLGAWLLAVVPLAAMRGGLGLGLVAWSLWMWRRRDRAPMRLAPRKAWAADAGVGIAGGALGGLAGLTGVLPALWCSLGGLDKAAQRGVVQGFILFTSLLALAWVGGVVGIDPVTREQLLWLLPVTLVGGLLGLKVFARLSGRGFTLVTLAVVGLCGALLVFRAWVDGRESNTEPPPQPSPLKGEGEDRRLAQYRKIGLMIACTAPVTREAPSVNRPS